MKFVGLLTLAIALSLFSRAQITADSNHLLGVDALAEDIRILKEVLETVHPALYRYTSKQNYSRSLSG